MGEQLVYFLVLGLISACFHLCCAADVFVDIGEFFFRDLLLENLIFMSPNFNVS